MATESPSIKIKFKLWRLCSRRLKSVFTRKHPSVGVVKHSFTAKHSGVGVKNLCSVPAPYAKECTEKEHSRATCLKVNKRTNATTIGKFTVKNNIIVIICLEVIK